MEMWVYQRPGYFMEISRADHCQRKVKAKNKGQTLLLVFSLSKSMDACSRAWTRQVGERRLLVLPSDCLGYNVASPPTCGSWGSGVGGSHDLLSAVSIARGLSRSRRGSPCSDQHPKVNSSLIPHLNAQSLGHFTSSWRDLFISYHHKKGEDKTIRQFERRTTLT